MRLRTKYDVATKLESFYDGGPVALSTNGELVACAHNDGIKVVSAHTSKILLALLGDSETLTAITFGGDSSILFGASRSLQLLCWSLATGKCIKLWKGHSSAVAHMAVDPTGGLLATGGADRTARVWDVAGFYCTHVFRGHRAPVQQVLFQTKDLALVTAAEDGEIRVWDLVSRTCTATLASAAAGHTPEAVQAHLAAVTSLSLSSDGWTLLSAGRDKVAAIWDLRTHRALRTVPVFEAVEGAEILRLENGPERPQPATGGRKRSFYFATAGESGVVKIWDSARGSCIASCSVDGGSEDRSQIASLSCSSGGALVATTADARILFFSVQAASEGSVDIQRTREMVGDLGEVTDVRFLGPSQAPTHIAVATNSSAIRIFSISNGSCQAVLYGHTDIVLALDAKSDANGSARLASGGKDAFLRLWKIEVTPFQFDQATPVSVTSTCLGSIKAHTSTVTAVLLGQKSTSSFVLSASSDKMLKVWETAVDGNGVMQSIAGIAAHAKDINSLSLSPDESLVCTTSQDRTAKIWKLPSLVHLLTLRGHRKGVWAAGFSPVEQTIATASADKTIKLWALKEGSCLRTFEGHTASVLRLLYINAGTQMVTSGADGLVKLWNIRSSECVATFDGHGDRVWALHGGGESDSLLVSGGSDATICIWRDVTRTVQQETATAKTAAVAAQQAFANAVQEGDLQKAASLAFMGNQPKQLQAAIETMQRAAPDDARELLKGLVSGFTPDQLKQALCLLRDWNTRVQFSPQAQGLLQAIFLCHSPKILNRVPGLEEILASLAPYTERHIAHVDRLLISGNVLDYTLNRMHNVDPMLQ